MKISKSKATLKADIAFNQLMLEYVEAGLDPDTAYHERHERIRQRLCDEMAQARGFANAIDEAKALRDGQAENNFHLDNIKKLQKKYKKDSCNEEYRKQFDQMHKDRLEAMEAVINSYKIKSAA